MVEFISNAPIRDTTKKAYMADLNTICKYTGETLYNVLMNPTIWIPVIYKEAFEQRRVKHKDASATKRTLIKSVLALLKHSGLKLKHNDVFCVWYKHFMEVSSTVQTNQDNNVQTVASISWASVKNKYKEAKPGTIERVTLALYTLIPPRRQQDYWKLRVRGDLIPGDTGQIDFEKKTITVYVFKTKDKYDTWTKELPDELLKEINDFTSNGTFNSEYIFSKRGGKSYGTLYSFTSANNKVIKASLNNQHASVNSIRHAAATFVNVDKHMLRKDKKQYAYDMGHSFSMQGMYVEAFAEDQ